MQHQSIDQLIDRARRAFLRRPEFTGRAAVIADSDIELRKGRPWVVLRDGEEIIAEFQIRKSGDLRFMRNGKH
jgi:hypothetical protein